MARNHYRTSFERPTTATREVIDEEGEAAERRVGRIFSAGTCGTSVHPVSTSCHAASTWGVARSIGLPPLTRRDLFPLGKETHAGRSEAWWRLGQTRGACAPGTDDRPAYDNGIEHSVGKELHGGQSNRV